MSTGTNRPAEPVKSDEATEAEAGFAAVLRRRRVAARLTQEQLAERAGLSARSVSQLERGRVRFPRPESVRLLGQALGLAGDELESFVALARARYWAGRDSSVLSSASTGGRVPVAPDQLPADPVDFVGRATELATLDRLLDSIAPPGDVDCVDDSPRSVAAVICGMAGVGKTALVSRWAQRMRQRFPDGQLFVDLTEFGRGRPVAVTDVLAYFLASLGVPVSEIPSDVDSQVADYRRQLAGRRMLVVIDGAESVEQVRPLLPTAGSSVMAVVTSRSPLDGLPAVHRMELDVLPAADAVTLLRSLVGARADAEPDAAAALAEACAGLPLALSVAAGVAVTRAEVPIADLVAELTCRQRRPAEPVTASTAARAVMAWSYRGLPAEASKAFRLIGAYPGPGIDAFGLAALIGTRLDAAGELLELLAAARVIRPASRAGRCAMPRPISEQARELAAAEDSEQNRRAALRRLLDYYAAAAGAALGALSGGRRDYGESFRAPGLRVELPEVAQPAAAHAWLEAERPALAAAATWAAVHGWTEHILPLATAAVADLDPVPGRERRSGAVGDDRAADAAPARVGGPGGVLDRLLIAEVERAAATRQEALLQEEGTRHRDRDTARDQSRQWRLIRDELAAVTRQIAAGRDQQAGRRWRWMGSPYRGLWPYGQEHTEVFYGRERVTAELVGKLAERLAGPSVVVVTGASGAGKSSLLRAGLLPALARGLLGVPRSAHWPRRVMTPTSRPLAELATHLSDLAQVDAEEIRRQLADHPEQAHLLVRQALEARGRDRVRASAGAVGPDDGRLVLVVDQFEQLYTLDHTADPDQPSAFLTALLAAAGTPCGSTGQPPALVVLGVRGDFIDRLAAHPRLAELLQDAHFIVGPMTEPELRRVITGPAAAAGLEIESGLVDTILGDLRGRTPGSGDTGTLPLLSQALHVTHRHSDGASLTVRGYGFSGGVAQAVARSAEAAYADLSAAEQAAAVDLFQTLTALAPDGAVTRRRVPLADLRLHRSVRSASGTVDFVVERLTDARLLVRDQDSVEIAHDILLTAWPRLGEWLADDHAGRVLYGDLVRQANRWQQHDRDPSFSYRGAELAAATALLTRWRAEPSRYPQPEPTTTAFLSASTRGQTRRRRVLYAVAAAVLLISSSLTGVALRQRQVAVEEQNTAVAQTRLAVARGLTARAAALRTTDIRTALQLGIAADRIRSTEETRNGLHATLVGTPLAATMAGQPVPSTAAFSRDGRTLMTGSRNGTAQAWQLDSTRHPIRVTGGPTIGDPNEPVRRGTVEPDGGHLGPDARIGPYEAIDADGNLLATAGDDHVVRLWDLTGSRRTLLAPLPAHTGPVTAVGFSRGGRILATASEDRTARLWDLGNRHRPALITTLTGHTKPLTRMAFSPDGRALILGTRDDTAWLWRLATSRRGTLTASLSGQLTVPGDYGASGRYGVLALGPGGRMLAAAADSGFDGPHSADVGYTAARVWDLKDLNRPALASVLRHSGAVAALAFSPDGRFLATASADRTARVWNLGQPGRPPQHTLTGHTEALTTVTFSSDGKALATTDSSGAVALWQLTNLRRPASVTAHIDSHVLVVPTFSRDGRILATRVSPNFTPQVWDLSDPGRPIRLHNMTEFRNSMTSPVLSPDGHTLVVESRRLTFLHVTGPRNPPANSIFDGGVRPTFSADGRILATVTPYLNFSTIRLWVSDRTGIASAATVLTRHAGHVTGKAFSPDGRVLVTASVEGTVKLWDVQDPRHPALITSFTDDVDGLLAMSFSPDGRILVTAGYDRIARLWDLHDLRRPALITTLTGHTDLIYAVAFSPDGRTLATASRDSTAKLWDLRDPSRPSLIATLTGHTAGITALAFTSDGAILRTASTDETVRTWDIRAVVGAFAEPIRTACTAAGGGLDAQQWRSLIPELPFQPTC